MLQEFSNGSSNPRVGTRIGSKHCSPTRPSRVLFYIALAGFTGCTYLRDWARHDFKVGPDYCEPPVSVATQWIELNDPQIINDIAGVDEVDWWQCFDDPTLVDLVCEARQQNLSLQSAELRVVEAEAQRAMAVGRLFPQFQEVFGSFEQRQRSPLGFSSGLPPLSRSLGVWTSGLNASWELDLWGRYRRSIASADANLQALANNYEDVLLTLTADTAAAYVELRAFQQRLDCLEDNRSKQAQSLTLAENRYKSGIVTKLDVTQAEASLHRTQALKPVLERGLRMANNRLCVLLGSPPVNLADDLGLVGDEPIPNPPQEVVVGIPADLIRRRPDVRRAERQVAAQSELIGVAAADLFPAFTINGSINWQARDLGDLFTPTANAGMINPGFNWNFLNYNRIINNVAVQDARFQQLAVTYAQTVLEANREVEDAIVDFQRSRDRADELRKAVDASIESVALAQLQYDEGWIDFDRLNNLQRELVLQQDESVAAKADVAFALIRIYRSLGGGWQPAPKHALRRAESTEINQAVSPMPVPAENHRE